MANYEIQNFIEKFLYPRGYSLKKRELKKWIYDNGYSQPIIAYYLDLELEVFKRMLREHEEFNRKQIELLVELMKAEAAFEVIFFPTNKMRKDVWWKVFGMYKEEKNE